MSAYSRLPSSGWRERVSGGPGRAPDQQVQEVVDLEADDTAVPAKELDAAQEGAERHQPTADQVTPLRKRGPARRTPPLGGLGADGGFARAPSRLCTRSAMGPS